VESEIQANRQALQELLELVEANADITYSAALMPNTSPIGKHVRHVLDHYNAIIRGCRCNRVDYDQRSRACGLETDRQAAIKQIVATRQFLAALPPGNQPMLVHTTICADSGRVSQISSSLQRELVYVLNHTVHHVAYIALLSRLQAQDVGVAPATQVALKNTEQSVSEKLSTKCRLAS